MIFLAEDKKIPGIYFNDNKCVYGANNADLAASFEWRSYTIYNEALYYRLSDYYEKP